MNDTQGQAVLDYYQGDETASLLIHNNYGSPEEMPVEVFFRDELDFSVLENLALIECQGRVLDLGAGAGAHSLVLQSRGFEVYALDYSTGCVTVMSQMGIKHCLEEDYRKHLGSYDTVLCLMNGLGLAGKLDQVPSFIRKCMSFLPLDGQLLIDSSDISYLYETTPKPAGYFGEVSYQYEYKGRKGGWFDWVYVDQQTLISIVEQMGHDIEILTTEDNDQYLARITQPATRTKKP